MTSRFASLTEQVIEKIVEDKDTQNTKSRRRGLKSCLLIKWKRKSWANLRKRKSWHKLWKHTFYVEARKKEFVQCIIKQLLDSVFVISRIIKVSVRVISRSRRLRLITPTSTLTLIILDITKTSSNNCLLLWKASMRCRIKQFARESVRLCPFRGLYVREFKLSHSNRVNRIIKITHAHNLFVKMLDFSPFTIRTQQNANCLLESFLKRF